MVWLFFKSRPCDVSFVPEGEMVISSGSHNVILSLGTRLIMSLLGSAIPRGGSAVPFSLMYGIFKKKAFPSVQNS